MMYALAFFAGAFIGVLVMAILAVAGSEPPTSHSMNLGSYRQRSDGEVPDKPF